jgi:hypothetical protein
VNGAGIRRSSRRLHITLSVLAAAAVLAGLALAAWRPWREEPAPVSATPVLAATAELRRTVQEPRAVAIAVENLGAEPVRVVRAELVGDSFAETGPFVVDVQVAPGLIRDVFLRHGEGRCGGQAAPPAAAARAVLEVVTVDSRRHSVELDLPYPNRSLMRRLSEDCTAQLLARSVRTELAALSPLPDGRLRGVVVVVERLAGDWPVELHEVAGTVLFNVVAAPRDTPRPVAVLPNREDRLEVPVTIDAARCSGHAIGEAKQRYTIHLWVTVGADERLHTTIEPVADQVSQLKEMQDRRCAG